MFLSPERRSKVLKFAKNDRLDVLIILAKDEQFLFSLENDPKGGPLDDFFSILGCIKLYNLSSFALLITSSPLTRIIQLYNIYIFV